MVVFVFTKSQDIPFPNFDYLQHHKTCPLIQTTLNDSTWIKHYVRDITILQLCCKYIRNYPECYIVNACMSCRFWPWLLSFMKTYEIPYGGFKVDPGNYHDETLHLINAACEFEKKHSYHNHPSLNVKKINLVTDLSQLSTILKYMMSSGIVPSNIIDNSSYPKDTHIIKIKIMAPTIGTYGIIFNIKDTTYIFDGIFYAYKIHAEVIDAIPNCAWLGVLRDSIFYINGVTYSSTDSMVNLMNYISNNPGCAKYRKKCTIISLGTMYEYDGLKILFPRILSTTTDQEIPIDESIVRFNDISGQLFVPKYIYASIEEIPNGI